MVALLRQAGQSPPFKVMLESGRITEGSICLEFDVVIGINAEYLCHGFLCLLDVPQSRKGRSELQAWRNEIGIAATGFAKWRQRCLVIPRRVIRESLKPEVPRRVEWIQANRCREAVDGRGLCLTRVECAECFLSGGCKASWP